MALVPMANSSRPSLRDRIFSKKQLDVADSPPARRVPFYKPRSFLSKVVTKVVPCVSGPATPLDAGFSSAPPSSVDSDVVVTPPLSAALLPEDETDGMTSGAVQPPGSSGSTDIFHTPTSHDSDSDRTSYSEDDHEIDDDDRLIRNGGSGIPFDLVRPLQLPSLLTYSPTGRSSKSLAPPRGAGASRSQMPRP